MERGTDALEDIKRNVAATILYVAHVTTVYLSFVGEFFLGHSLRLAFLNDGLPYSFL